MLGDTIACTACEDLRLSLGWQKPAFTASYLATRYVRLLVLLHESPCTRRSVDTRPYSVLDLLTVLLPVLTVLALALLLITSLAVNEQDSKV